MHVKATDFKNQLGHYIQTSIKEPVFIEKSGRPSSVLISSDEYERLSKFEDLYWGNLAIQAIEEAGFLGVEKTEQKLSEWAKRLNDDAAE